MYDEEDSRAIDAFNDAVHRACQAWLQDRDEPWPGWVNMSPQMRAGLGLPEPPLLKDPAPLPPHLDSSSPDFQPPWCRHPSMLSQEARARIQAQRAAITEAEAAVPATLDADFAAREPEAEP